jgi:hypothetical protein
LFPTKIRYTSMSLPYHIGNGWFGGMLPLLATAMVASSGNIYYGLWYPIIVALMTVVIGALFLKDNKDRDINEYAFRNPSPAGSRRGFFLRALSAEGNEDTIRAGGTTWLPSDIYRKTRSGARRSTAASSS